MVILPQQTQSQLTRTPIVAGTVLPSLKVAFVGPEDLRSVVAPQKYPLVRGKHVKMSENPLKSVSLTSKIAHF